MSAMITTLMYSIKSDRPYTRMIGIYNIRITEPVFGTHEEETRRSAKITIIYYSITEISRSVILGSDYYYYYNMCSLMKIEEQKYNNFFFIIINRSFVIEKH